MTDLDRSPQTRPYDTEVYVGLPVLGTLTDSLARTVEARGDQTAVRSTDGRLRWTWTELAAEADRLASVFAGLGISHGDRVALLMTNRPEFFAIDLALVRLGAVPFSLYPTSAPDQHAFVLDDSGAVAVIVEATLRARLPIDALPPTRIVIDGPASAGWLSLADLPTGDHRRDRPSPSPDDLLTIIYTSGTTGPPKGVMITHRAAMYGADASLRVVRPRAGTIVISWLPAAHIGERMVGYIMTIVHGMEAVTLDDPRRLLEAIPREHPGYLAATPRIYEKLRADLEGWILHQPADVQATIRHGMAAGRDVVRARQQGQQVAPGVERTARHLQETLLSPWRQAAGLDALVVAMTGAAANPGELMEYFHAIGVPLNEIYALSESGAAGSGVPIEEIRFGTVGRASPHVELSIADDGEILLRGPTLMSGYLGRPVETAEAIDPDGWLHTGDLGSLDDDGYLTITGRKKELIISSHGKNIAPVAVEATIMAQSPLIAQMMCVGDGRPFLVALMVIDLDYALQWAAGRGVVAATREELVLAPEIRAELERAVEAGNALLNGPEQIRRFAVLDVDWTPETGLLTPTSKMRRVHIRDAFQAQIDALYA